MIEYRLQVPDELWNQFKESLSKAETFNDRIVELIENEVDKEVTSDESE